VYYLYESETGCLIEEDVKRIEAMEMWIWKKIENISWQNRVSNETVIESW